MEDTAKRKSDSVDVDDVRGIVGVGSGDMGGEGIPFLLRLSTRLERGEIITVCAGSHDGRKLGAYAHEIGE